MRRLTLGRASVVVGATAVALSTYGCGLFFDPGELGAGVADAADRDQDAAIAPVPDAGLDAATGAEGCPSGEGPLMVRIDDFCVDSTEVTRAQYARFVAAIGADAGGPAGVSFCDETNTSLAPIDPEQEFPPAKETSEFPVRGIDWCDAKAYCLWAGKDLCGGLRGAKLASTDATDPAKSQWAKACTKDGMFRFAYADSYASGNCVEGTQPSQPTSRTCEGGYAGLFDMVGNVAEWVDACRDAPSKNCALVGRSPGSNDVASCAVVSLPPGDVPWNSAGVRCCAPARDR